MANQQTVTLSFFCVSLLFGYLHGQGRLHCIISLQNSMLFVVVCRLLGSVLIFTSVLVQQLFFGDSITRACIRVRT